MVNSSINGKINTDNASTNVKLTLDADSSIVLTGNSYISSLTNADSTGNNINKGSYTFADNNGNDLNATGTQTASTTGASTTSTTTADSTASTTTADSTTTSSTAGVTSLVSSSLNLTEDENFTIINSARKNLSNLKYLYALFLLVILF